MTCVLKLDCALIKGVYTENSLWCKESQETYSGLTTDLDGDIMIRLFRSYTGWSPAGALNTQDTSLPIITETMRGSAESRPRYMSKNLSSSFGELISPSGINRTLWVCNTELVNREVKVEDKLQHWVMQEAPVDPGLKLQVNHLHLCTACVSHV